MMVLEAGGGYSRHTHRNRQGSRKETKLTPGDDLSWWSWVLWKKKKKEKEREREGKAEYLRRKKMERRWKNDDAGGEGEEGCDWWGTFW